jgi:hypothetical protein
MDNASTQITRVQRLNAVAEYEVLGELDMRPEAEIYGTGLWRAASGDEAVDINWVSRSYSFGVLIWSAAWLLKGTVAHQRRIGKVRSTDL